MTTTHWFLLIGCLMLARGLAATTISRSPFTSAIVYLGLGLLLGPSALDILDFDPLKQSGLLEVLTEVAVLISLFSAGVKMPVPITLQRWAPSIRLAWLSMSISVGLVALFAWQVFGMAPGAAILLGGILAPTDPVLATDVQVRHPGDRDELRFMLTCEAGMNDGSAFPFVMLGLGMLGLHNVDLSGIGITLEPSGGDLAAFWRWLLIEVLWATLAAIAIGAASGAALARLSWRLRGGDEGKHERHELLDDLIGLGLIGVVYGLTVSVAAWGFLAVFFAGVALRQTELRLAGAPTDRHGLLEPDTSKSDAAVHSEDHAAPATVSTGALVFKEHLERLSELTLVLLLGGMLSLASLDWRAFAMAAFLFCVARPLSVFIGLAVSAPGLRPRAMAAWFGVRGIGSIYYLMYALQHGVRAELGQELISITLAVVMLSILVHGTSVKPLMDRYWPT